MSRIKQSRGFTLIEIMVVLATIGLLFIIIFLAVAAAQRSQRDTTRKDAVNQLVAAIQQQAQNSNSVYPACWWSDCIDPSLGHYQVNWTSPTSIPMTLTSGGPSLTAIQWVSYHFGPFSYCTGNTSNNSGAVQVALEAGGYYCVSY